MSLIPCSKFCHFPLLHFPLSLLLPLYSVSLSGASYSTFSGNILLPSSLAPPLPTCTSYSTYSCSSSCTSFCTLFCTFFSTSLAFYYYDSFSSSSSSFSCSSVTPSLLSSSTSLHPTLSLTLPLFLPPPSASSLVLYLISYLRVRRFLLPATSSTTS